MESVPQDLSQFKAEELDFHISTQVIGKGCPGRNINPRHASVLHIQTNCLYRLWDNPSKTVTGCRPLEVKYHRGQGKTFFSSAIPNILAIPHLMVAR